MASIKPLGDRVLVEPRQEAEEKIGSIFVPDTAKENHKKGKLSKSVAANMKTGNSSLSK